jgi:hypothetical protein
MEPEPRLVEVPIPRRAVLAGMGGLLLLLPAHHRPGHPGGPKPSPTTTTSTPSTTTTTPAHEPVACYPGACPGPYTYPVRAA